MAMPTMATLTNSSVNGGLAIDLKATSINTTWQAYTTVPDKPKKDSTLTYDQVLSKGTNQGFKNPTHVITVTLTVAETHTSDVANVALTYELVQDLMMNADVVCTLTSNKFITSTNAAGSINVMLKNYSDTLPNTNIFRPNITVQEVSSSS